MAKKLSKAEELEKRAKRKLRESKEYLYGPTQGEVARLYEKAGDAWIILGKYPQALENYNQAKRYAYNKRIIKRIEEKMYDISKKYKKDKKRDVFGRKLKISGLEKSLVFGILSIISLLTSLLFISVNLTGYTVINVNVKNVFPLEVLFFFFGLVFAFLYFKFKKGE